jgi:DNA end-binding protein Ku
MLQLKYADEVKSTDDIPVPSVRIAEKELDLAEQLISHHASDAFDPTQYKDEVRLRKLELIQGKVKAGEIEEAPEADEAEAGGAAVDLMAALEASLAGAAGARGHASNGHRKTGHRARPARAARGTRRSRPAARRAHAGRRRGSHAAKSH